MLSFLAKERLRDEQEDRIWPDTHVFEQRAIVVSRNEEECHRIALRNVVSSAVTVFVVSRNVPPRDFEPHSSLIIFTAYLKNQSYISNLSMA